MRIRHQVRMSLTVVTVLALLGCGAASEAPPDTDASPAFEVDPTWPNNLPERWIMSQVTGLYVDARDHVWVVHQPAVLTPREIGAAQDPPIAECCFPAPPVIEFDPDGDVVQAWGGPDDGYPDFPDSPHGIFVDHQDNVWIGSNATHQVMKFTRDGQHLFTIGDPETSGGSNDPETLGGPADMYVDPDGNLLYVADGYRNRRVVVFDADTGEYVRHWGAYGERPDDDHELGPRGADDPPAEQFSTVHGIIVSNDGLVYVADRRNNRIQVFRKSGEYVTERLVAPGTLASGSAFSLGLSPDPEQEFLYLADGTNHKVWIFRRDGLEVVGEFGRPGRQIGQFIRVHNLSVDSRGNIYTGEAATGRRVQRFVPAGPDTSEE